MAALGAWLGGNSMAGRHKLKAESDVRKAIVDAAIEPFRPLIEAEIGKRFPAEAEPDQAST